MLGTATRISEQRSLRVQTVCHLSERSDTPRRFQPWEMTCRMVFRGFKFGNFAGMNDEWARSQSRSVDFLPLTAAC